MLAYAKSSLKITAAQESAWNTVADVVRKHAKAHDEDAKKMRARFDSARDAKTPPTPPNGIEMLQLQQQRLTQRAKELDELLAAAKPLYASLSDDQKKAADRLLHHGRGMGRGGPHMMGPH
jgi:predicted secreted Zn-dependent protease